MSKTHQTKTMSTIIKHTLLTTGILMSLSAPALAQDFAQGSRPMGMGEAFTAVSTGTSGIFQNPAGIARAILYAVEGSYTYTPTGNILSVGIVDSKTNPSISAGFALSYYFDRANDQGDITALDIRLPLAIPIVPERISVGIGLRYLSVENNEVETLSGFTLDAGALFRVADALHLGIAAKNLIDPCDIDSKCGGLAPLTIGGGVAYGTGTSFTVAADLDFDLNSSDGAELNFALGGEYLIQNMIPVRLGFKREGLSQSNILTVGGGWRSPTAGLDAAYQHILSSETRDTGVGFFNLGVSVYF